MHEEKGVITLEACISVLSFMILMFILSGIFIMHMAQNATAHALLQTSQSLSLDYYAASKVGNGTDEGKLPASLQEILVGFLKGKGNSKIIPADDNPFATNADITKSPETVAKAARTRFIEYLANGDEKEADAMLKQMNVVNGLNGLDFSESSSDGSDLHIVLVYQMDYEFQVGTLGRVDVRQETSSRLWK